MTISASGITACNMSDGSGGASASVIPSAQIYKTNNSAQQTVTATNTPIKIVSTTTFDSDQSNDWSSPSSNRITYTGTKSHKAKISAFCSGYMSGAEYGNAIIYKNGSVLNSVVFSNNLFLNSGDKLDSIIWFTDDVVTDDYYEIWINATANGADYYCEVLTLSAEFEGWI